MSLTTLLEAAKYLDYLDSSQNIHNNNPNQNQSLNSQHDQQHQHHKNIYQNEPLQTTAQGQSSISGGTSTHFRPIKKSPGSAGRPRARRVSGSSRKQHQHGNNDIIAMSLPASATLGQASGLHQLASAGSSASFMMMTSKSPPPSAGILSSSYTGPGSPQSSPTSIALLSSKTSGVTSNISSAASSLSSSDTSSSCGEIIMNELDFNQCATSVSSNCSLNKHKTIANHHDYHKQQPMHQHQSHLSHTNNNTELSSNIQQLQNNNNIYNNNHLLTHPFMDANAATRTYYEAGPSSGHSMPQPITGGQNDNSRRVAARRKASKSAGAKGLMTLASSAGTHHQHLQSLASTSVPLESSLHAGRVFHATSVLDNGSGQLKFAAQPAHQYHPSNRSPGSALDLAYGSTYMSVSPSYFTNALCTSTSTSGLTNQSSPPTQQSGSLIMARVQPMIFQHNSLAQQQQNSATKQQSIMAFQQAAPSPTSTSSSYSRHRELHKTLEKNRRAHLRHCFELLKAELPSSECVDRKTSHINIIRSAIRCVVSLIEQGSALEQELKRQLDTKNKLKNQLSNLKGNLMSTTSYQQPVAEQQLSFLLSQSKID